MTECDYAATSNVIALNEDQGDATDQNIRVKDNKKATVCLRLLLCHFPSICLKIWVGGWFGIRLRLAS